MKSNMEEKYNSLEDKVQALEISVHVQLSTIERKKLTETMKELIKEEIEKAKKTIEEDINNSFNFSEGAQAEKMLKMDQVAKDMNDLEQYTRKNSVRIHGLAEELMENAEEIVLEFFKEKLQVDMQPAEIEIVHRVGARVGVEESRQAERTKPRPLIVKFLSHRSKENVMRKKKL